MAPPVDSKLLARTAILVALTELVPLPLVDRFLEEWLRRRLVRAIARRHGVKLPRAAVKILGGTPSSGCWWLVTWPLGKLLRAVSVVFQIKSMFDNYADVLHRGLLLEEAFAQGWAQADPARVRAAMDRSLSKVDTRPIERRVFGRFRDRADRLNRLVAEATRIARAREADPTELVPASEASPTLTAAIRAGLVAELVPWFRLEMGDVPALEARVQGAVTPELLPAPVPEAPAAASPVFEDAVEVPKREPED